METCFLWWRTPFLYRRYSAGKKLSIDFRDSFAYIVVDG